MKRTSFILITMAACLMLFSCATSKKAVEEQAAQKEIPAEKPVIVLPAAEQQGPGPEQISETISMIFAGDIMAHEENFRMDNFSIIWKDIVPLLKSSDLCFANIEGPVCSGLPWHAYPLFNMHASYANAAVAAGFNVFSLANNHANDQELTGIRGTQSWADACMKRTATTTRPVHAAGLKQADEPLSYQYFSVRNWKILFLPVTELLNSPRQTAYINYISSTAAGRTAFIQQAALLRKKHPCDIFIISVHSNEEEYIRTVSSARKSFYHSLISSGSADVVWSNHPHVVKEWEKFGKKSDGSITGLIMYANGNTISGQRRDPQFNAPDTPRDYTGDGLLLRVIFSKKVYNKNTGKIPEPVRITSAEPVLITTYIDPSDNYVIKQLDTALLTTLKQQGNKKWASYLQQRKILMEKIKGKTIWQ